MFCLFIILALCISSCSSDSQGLKVAATAIPHAEILEFIKPDLEVEGIHLKIIISDDYNIPNRALADKEIDANFFQHRPFLDRQIEAFGYEIESIGAIEIEPMGLYSHKIHTISDLKDNGVVAIPNDPSNEARALSLLQAQGLIKLTPPNDPHATLINILENPKNLKFIEVDAAMIPRTLEDVDLGVINTNFVLGAGLSPSKDALVLEEKDSPYANLLVIRKGDAERSDIQALKAALTSEKMKDFLYDKYQGAVFPAW